MDVDLPNIILDAIKNDGTVARSYALGDKACHIESWKVKGPSLRTHKGYQWEACNWNGKFALSVGGHPKWPLPSQQQQMMEIGKWNTPMTPKKEEKHAQCEKDVCALSLAIKRRGSLSHNGGSKHPCSTQWQDDVGPLQMPHHMLLHALRKHV